MSGELVAGSIWLKLGADTSDLEQGVKKVDSFFGKFGGFAKTAGVALAGGLVAAGAATIGFGKQALDASSELTVTQMKYETILGSQEAATKRAAELTAFAARTPFELGDVQKADIILQGFGIRSEKLLDTVGNAAAISGSSFGDLGLIIGQISQSKDLDNIKQLVERGVVSFDELKKAGISFAKDGSIVNSVEETYGAVVGIIDKKFAGGMDKLSNTLPGKVSTMNDTIKSKLAEFAKKTGLETFATNAITTVTGFISTIDIDGLFNKLTTGVNDLIKTGQGVGKWISDNQVWLVPLGAVIGSVAAAWGLWNLALGAYAVFTAAATAATTVFGAAVAIATSPITLIGLAIGAVIAIGWLLYKNWDTISMWATQVWNAIWGTITSVANNIWNTITQVWNAIWGSITTVLTQIWNAVVQGWNAIFSTISGVVRGIWDFIVWVFTEVLSFYVGLWSAMFYTVYNAANDIWDTIVNIFSIVVDWFRQVWDNTISAVKGIWDGFISLLQGVWDAIKMPFENMGESIKNVFSGIDLFQMGRDMIQGLVDGIKNMAGSVTNAVSNSVNGAVDAAKRALGIHSPSRVMKYEIGYNMVDGWTEGIDERKQDLFGSVEDMSYGAFASSTVGAGGSVGGVSQIAGNNYTTNVYGSYLGTDKDKREFGREMKDAWVDIFPQLKTV
jgi:phage-related protein